MGLKRRSTVLLVEDDAPMGLDLSEALNLAGYQVVGPATSRADAARPLHGEGPDPAIIAAALAADDCALDERLLSNKDA